jgi:DNA-binding LacI/PurR family transcriptional regulator
VHERLQAYRDALQAHDLPADDSLVVLGEYHTDAGWPSLRTGYDYMARLLEQQPGVTAVVAGSDLLAAGALQALYERRIRVPDEASVIGFDDTFAGHLAPPLTTVRQPMFEMGTRAAALALELAESDPGGRREVWLKTELVVRGSTAAPRVSTNKESR